MHDKNTLRSGIAVVLTAIGFLSSLAFGEVHAELIVSDDIPVDMVPSRILPDSQSDEYWIVGFLEGLLLLAHDESGQWIVDEFSGYEIVDAAGPTSDGLIYCTYVSSQSNPIDTGIVVFNCTSHQFTATIDLPWEYGLSAIAVGANEQRLFVGAATTDEDVYSVFDASEHSGLIIEVDIASASVLRTCSVRAWPETIFVWNGEKLLVSCQEPYWGQDDDYMEVKTTTSIIALSTFTKIAEIPSNYADWPHTNDLVRWNEDFVALFNFQIYLDYQAPTYADALWLIDPSSAAVVGSINVRDGDSNEWGVKHGLISEACPELVYLGLMCYEGMWEFPLIVADRSGVYVDHAVTPAGFSPEFIYEVDDEQIIVTDAVNERIYILEWVNYPPMCNLVLITPMPYVGPSPAEIEFDATGSYDPDPCDELTFEWDFDGDHVFGEPVDDAYTGPPDNPTHSYTEDYTGLVTLKLTDNHGAESLCSVDVEVDIT